MPHESLTEAQAQIQRLTKRLERERKARAEAEAIAENGLRTLYEKQRDIELLQEIASAANQAYSLNDVLQYTLTLVCKHIGWPIGHVYVSDPANLDQLISTGIWHFSAPHQYEPFRRITEAMHLRRGTGLPGTVMLSKQPAWFTDVSTDVNFSRAAVARECDLRAGFAFGVWGDDDGIAVLEFYTQESLPIDTSTLAVMEHIGTLLSRVVERERASDRIQFLAYHDTLTQLPNRRLLKDRLDVCIAQAARHRRQLGVLFLDLDRFKSINDSLGHKGGDALLSQFTERLQQCIRKGDTLARWAGDEFVILLAEIEGIEDMNDVAMRVLQQMENTFLIAGHEIFVTCSIGAAVWQIDLDNSDTLIKNADMAMYYAKEKGRNRYERFTPELSLQARGDLLLESNLRKALVNDEFVVYYQPQVGIKSGEIIGMEALVRWAHPELGTIAPEQFIPLSEETGLIIPLGAWILETACSQVATWNKEGNYALRLSVNISLHQFQQNDFAKFVADVLSKTGLEPALLDLEITESVAIENLASLLVNMQEIKKLGVHLSLDDFGTGYSSLSNLSSLPMDTVKIDKSFIQSMLGDPRNAAIAKSIILLAQSLNLSVIAEGVELQQQMDFLAAHDCDIMQGFLFSKPVDANELTWILATQYKPASLEDD